MSFKGGKKSNVHKSKEGYDLYAGLYDKTLEFLDSFERNELKRMIYSAKGKKVLDVGCGTGRLFPEFQKMNFDITGIDVSQKMIDIAKNRCHKAKLLVGDVENLPFKDDSFDVVVASFVVVHLKYLEKAFSEIYRVLKNGGVFIITNINQKKAPKLKMSTTQEIVIKSFYHMPKEVIKSLENEFFKINEEKFLYDGEIWINQIIKASK
jgi:ubiquinone/menaquinone biosynthesis C-methylase UbiE